MGGIKGVVLQERDRRLLQALQSFRVVDRMQAMRVAGFRSIPRANSRLLQLRKGGLLRRFFPDGHAIGRRAIYSLPDKRSFQGPTLSHQLALNSVRLAFTESDPESNFRSVTRPLLPISQIIPDGYVKSHGTNLFLEIDLGTEPRKVLASKASGYVALALSGQIPRFRVAVVTTSDRRARSIAQAIHGVTDKLFFISTFEKINSASPHSSIWMRPDGRTEQALM